MLLEMIFFTFILLILGYLSFTFTKHLVLGSFFSKMENGFTEMVSCF